MWRIYAGTLLWDPQRRCDVTAAGNFGIQCAHPKVDVGRSTSLKNAFSIGIYSGLRHIPTLQEAFEVYVFQWSRASAHFFGDSNRQRRASYLLERHITVH